MWAHVSHFGGRICGELGGAYAFAANAHSRRYLFIKWFAFFLF